MTIANRGATNAINAGKSTADGKLALSNYASKAWVLNTIHELVGNAVAYQFNLQNTLIASTGNLVEWNALTNIPAENIRIEVEDGKADIFQSIDTTGFVVSAAGAARKSDFPVYVQFFGTVSGKEYSLGVAIINYSMSGAKSTNINFLKLEEATPEYYE